MYSSECSLFQEELGSRHKTDWQEPGGGAKMSLLESVMEQWHPLWGLVAMQHGHGRLPRRFPAWAWPASLWLRRSSSHLGLEEHPNGLQHGSGLGGQHWPPTWWLYECSLGCWLVGLWHECGLADLCIKPLTSVCRAPLYNCNYGMELSLSLEFCV